LVVKRWNPSWSVGYRASGGEAPRRPTRVGRHHLSASRAASRTTAGSLPSHHGPLRRMALLPPFNIGQTTARLEPNRNDPAPLRKGAGSKRVQLGRGPAKSQRFLPKTTDAGRSSTGAVPALP